VRGQTNGEAAKLEDLRPEMPTISIIRDSEDAVSSTAGDGPS